MPKVTVILTSFNHAKYLRQAIESVLNQTFQDFEFIIWDDASSDDSWEIIRSYSDSRILRYRNETSRRGIYGINKAISEIAKGEYIAIHHSDDIWQPDKLQKQVEILQEHSKYGAVFTKAIAVDEDGSPLQNQEHFYARIFDQPNRTRYEWLYYFFTEGNALCHPSVMVRKECYSECGLYRYGFAQLGDFDMWVRLCMKYDIYILPEKLIKFRVRNNEANASANTIEKRSRLYFEYYSILSNYLKIDSFEELNLIFEGARKYKNDNVFLKEFVFAMVLLDESKFALARILGLQLLFNLLNDPETSEIVEDNYAFDYTDFVKLTAKYSIANKSVEENEIETTKLAEFNRGIAECTRGLAECNRGIVESYRGIAECNRVITEQFEQIEKLKQQIDCFKFSSSWTITAPLRFFKRALMSLNRRFKQSLKQLIRRFQKSEYDLWRRTSGIKEAEEILTRLPQLVKPLISIIVPTYNTDEKHLRACIESVLAQSYTNWELCIADDASPQQSVREVITEYSKQDSRIKFVFRPENGHISEAMISAAELMEGDYISFLDHDDELNKNALLFIVDAINRSPESEFFYSDEDHINGHGKHLSPFFKPDWSPSLLCSQNYIGHFLCLSKSLYERIGGIRRGFDGAQDYDLVLRAGDAAENVYHIPKVLYHWREHDNSTSSNSESKPYAHEAGKAAVADFLKQKYGSRFIKVNDGEGLFTYSPQFRFDSEHRVSIIIPTKDKIDLLDDCIESIRNRSSHINWEIIIVDNRSEETASQEYFSTVVQDSRIKVVEADVEFNWSMINNIGAKAATGDVFVFLNNDTLVITPDWIEKVASMASLPEVGLVGPQLLYEDNTIQHAGVVVGMGGWADHVFKNQLPVHRSGPFVSPMLNRNVLAITGACQVIERAKFEQLGGFDEQFIICGSDVDICIRAHQQGLQNVYCADAALHHLESKSRSSFIPKQDFLMSEIKYAPYRNEKGDPYFNENLDLMSTMPRVLTNA